MLFDFPFYVKHFFFILRCHQFYFLEGRQLHLIGEAIKFTSKTFIGHHTFQKALLSSRKLDDFFTIF